MYIPATFAEHDRTRLHDFIERNSFGLLISHADGQLVATHLPFLLDRTAGPHGTLITHLARANLQWREASGQIALAIFSGPHTYVSPTWYEAEQVVPTWNYSAVHAYGRAEVIEEKRAVRDIVQRFVAVYEQTMPQPWSFDSASPYAKRLLAQIVGFRIEINQIEGKFKLSQNQPAERRKKVIRALQERDDDNAQAVAAMMRALLPVEE